MPSFGIWECVVGLVAILLLCITVVGVLGLGAVVVGFVKGFTNATLKPMIRKDTQKPYDVTPEAVMKRRRK